MLHTLHEIGKYICKKEKQEPLRLSLKEQFGSFGVEKEIAIKLEEKNGKMEFIGVNNPVEIDVENCLKYGALQTNSKGANLILFGIFRGSEAKKIRKGKRKENVLIIYEDNILDFFEEESKYKEAITKNSEIIEKTLLSIDYAKDEWYLMTVSVNGKYPNEIEYFKKILIQKEKTKNIDKSKGISFKEKGICSICGHKEVYLVGLLNLNDSFSFFNFNKEIFARSFNTSNAYKNTAICEKCASYINFASHFINKRLRSFKKPKVKNSEYFVIPILLKNLEESFADFEKFLSLIELARRSQGGERKVISESNRTQLDSYEDYLSEIIAELEDNIQFNLYFYKKAQKKRELQKMIKEVLPSRLRGVLEINKEVEDIYRERIGSDKKNFYPLSVIWSMILKKDTPNEENPKNYHFADYLAYLAPIFSPAEKIDYRFFLNNANTYIIELIQKYDKISHADFKFLDLFYLKLFLEKSDIFFNKEEMSMDLIKLKKDFEREYSTAKFVDAYWEQFESYPIFFNRVEKCFAFLMGKLTAETRRTRGDKGSFLDGWLSNFSTNIYKLPQLMERCIETLAIEDMLLRKQNNILAITSFFSKLISQETLADIHEELIFPFVAGFTFYTKFEQKENNNKNGGDKK